MKKLLSVLLICALIFTVSACGSEEKSADSNNAADTETFATNENAQLFFDKILENKKLIDPIFTSVCSAWKGTETKADAKVSDVNKAIEEALNQHTESIATIEESDKTLDELYELALKCPASSNVKAVMKSYETYRDSVLNADASTTPGGYNDASVAKNSLDKNLRNLRTVLGS